MGFLLSGFRTLLLTILVSSTLILWMAATLPAPVPFSRPPILQLVFIPTSIAGTPHIAVELLSLQLEHLLIFIGVGICVLRMRPVTRIAFGHERNVEERRAVEGFDAAVGRRRRDVLLRLLLRLLLLLMARGEAALAAAVYRCLCLLAVLVELVPAVGTVRFFVVVGGVVVAVPVSGVRLVGLLVVVVVLSELCT